MAKTKINQNEILNNERSRLIIRYAFFKMQNKETDFSLEETEEFLNNFMGEYDSKVVSEKMFASITDEEIEEAQNVLKDTYM
ncbi:MAG: hypothetical protein ACRCX5_05250 [Bacteroidales bacterium]